MNIEHINTSSRTFTRHDLKAILPAVVRRIHAAEFSSQSDMARAYGVDKATTTRWKRIAFAMGLTDDRAWRCGLLLGRMNKELAA